MQKEFTIQVPPEVAGTPQLLLETVCKLAALPSEQITHIEILKRSVDARQRAIKINLKVLVFIDEEFQHSRVSQPEYSSVAGAKEIAIIGAGPAALFAALECIKGGLKPVIFERGKDVGTRPIDLKGINVRGVVNEDSNYCFGEGGAGTYSDGKLYTRSTKRGNVEEILKLLVAFGAHHRILVDAHPHIGTNKLPPIIKAIREYIVERGGEVHFNTRIVDILVDNNTVNGVQTANGDVFKYSKVILATGHSARDIFELLARKKIAIELKPIAVGVRVEHAQSLIDRIQYGLSDRGEFLPPSPYSVVKQVRGRGVYSFCMCPGGVIAPAATSPGEIVTNGWSSSSRSRVTANSGIVVELRAEDFQGFAQYGPLAAMEFQRSIEQKAWAVAGKTQVAPAQRLVDFTTGIQSADLPKTSYPPGICSVELGSVLPPEIYRCLQEGCKAIGASMPGFLINDAVVHAPETRTSSPVRIPRSASTLEHIQVAGLYPCGEGAGYAGGIISAAIDGINCAQKCVQSLS